MACEFCQQDFNRPDGAYECPYCSQRWDNHKAITPGVQQASVAEMRSGRAMIEMEADACRRVLAGETVNGVRLGMPGIDEAWVRATLANLEAMPCLKNESR